MMGAELSSAEQSRAYKEVHVHVQDVYANTFYNDWVPIVTYSRRQSYSLLVGCGDWFDSMFVRTSASPSACDPTRTTSAKTRRRIGTAVG